MLAVLVVMKSSFYAGCLGILANLVLAILIHFRGLLPNGLAEIIYLIFVAILFLWRPIVSRNQRVFLILSLLFPSAFLVSHLFSQSQSESFGYLMAIFFNSLLFFTIPMVFYAAMKSQLKMFVRVSGLVGFFAAASLFLFYFGNSVFADYLYIRGFYARSSGFLGAPNYFGLAMLVSFFISVITWRRTNWGAWYIGLTGLGLAASLSRGAILGFFIFLFVIFLFEQRSRALTLKSLLYLAILSTTVLAISPGHVTSSLQGLILRRLQDEGGGGQSRLRAAQSAIEAFGRGNVIIGAGRAPYAAINSDGQPPHNSYVTILLDGGLLGLLVFGLTLFLVFLVSVCFYPANVYPLAIFASLSVIAFTNDFFLTKEWWIGLAIPISMTKYAFKERARHF